MNTLNASNITRANLAEAVSATLALCVSRLQDAKRVSGSAALIRELHIALDALRLIDSELRGGPLRPLGQRSAAFTRYVIDEEEHMVMEPELRDTIVHIEDLHSRM